MCIPQLLIWYTVPLESIWNHGLKSQSPSLNREAPRYIVLGILDWYSAI